MIHIITSFYISNLESGKNGERNIELQNALNNNLSNPLIDTVHLYVDNNEALEYILSLNNPKIVIISVGSQPLYSDLFNYANKELNDKICMVTNSDIYLHKCDIEILNKLNEPNVVFAMTRYEHDLSCLQIYRFYGSHDSFIFKSPINIDIDCIQHNQNVLGSENVVCYELRKNNNILFNPCYQIRIVHLHLSQVRNPRNRINQTRSSWCRPNIILTDNDKISVIISTYNNFQSLLNMIKSVKNQTYKNIEIIVVNNCSTEQEYYDYDWSGNNIIITHLKELFNGPQHNLGIELSTGKYVTLCTDTDYWFPKKLETQLNEMIKTVNQN